MLGRLGFSGRIIAIVLLALLLVTGLSTVIDFVMNRQHADETGWALLPARAAAVVDLLDRADRQQRDLILKAINSETVGAKLLLTRPTGQSADRRVPSVEWILDQFLSKVGSHEILAFVEPQEKAARWTLNLGQLHFYARESLKVAIGLYDGTWVQFETRVEISPTVLGLPPGFMIGIVGGLVGIAALLAIAREAKPFHELAASLVQFAIDAQPRPVKPRGAPEAVRLIGAINNMQEQIATLLKGRTILLGAISHDLKTFITRLRLRIEDIPAEEQRTKATRDLDDMTAMIDDALSIARNGYPSGKRDEINVADLIARDVSDRHDSRLALATEKQRQSDGIVLGDTAALRRLFDNLIDNALRHGDRVRVSITSADACLTVSIDDNGPGIPQEERTAVFEPFYRLDASRSRATGGSGLGLTIAKQITEGHGGRIHAEASDLGGAQFVVRLPIVRLKN